MSQPVEERLKICQKLPPSPLPSELLRAASYARRRRGFGAGGRSACKKKIGIISLCWLHSVGVVSYYYLNFFLVSV